MQDAMKKINLNPSSAYLAQELLLQAVSNTALGSCIADKIIQFFSNTFGILFSFLSFIDKQTFKDRNGYYHVMAT